jgi:hypothetical protein
MFELAPQHTLYPDPRALPSAAAIASFLREYGIDYIYVDAMHPNSLVADAIPVTSDGEFQVLRLP